MKEAFMADDAYTNYEPAPLNQGGFSRFARSSAGAAIGGTKGAVAGYLLTPLLGALVGIGVLVGLPIVGAALLGSLGAFGGIGAAVTGTLAVAGPALAISGAILGVIGGFAVAPFGGLVGGAYGGFKGLNGENQRAGVDQAFYDLSLAEATARGAAQGQALAYMRNGALPNANVAPITTQPTMRDSAINVDALMTRKDQPVQEKGQLDTMVQTDTVVNKDSIESKGASPISLSHADKVAAASNTQHQALAGL